MLKKIFSIWNWRQRQRLWGPNSYLLIWLTVMYL